ncbi:DivIVA domain-containing protein [Iamia majanohamensis]|uniref:Cell wall synthesis protein Wag31 n=1 Tax=Iamia majanohamensis TaxID=467976 RepID=A0AAF0BSG0_9ACTN|nr:DivIVA domain-containing protein [Iamia majanohamensis]WCO65212.1 DivIVA domain-containing protein [Iamia majanohamensis]
MDVSSSLSGPKEFRIVKRGYDPDEVDAFLDQIALGVSELKRKLAEASDAATAPAAPAAPSAEDEARAEEIHRALILAQRAADEELRKATEEAEAIRADAQAAADDSRVQSDAAAAQKRTAVEEEVARRREEGRSALLEEIRELEGIRDSLAGDVVVLERHVDEQREVVQAAIGELQSLLDHPEAFRIATETGVETGSHVEVEPITVPDADAGAAGTDQGAEAPAAPAPSILPPAAPAPEPDPAPAAEEEPAAGEPLPGVDDLRAELQATEEAPEDLEPRFAPSAEAAPALDLTTPPADEPDPGPPTEALAPAGGADSEDAFLAELRKAMLDEEPLGPRSDDAGAAGTGPVEAEEPARGRSRFGRRR